MKQLDKRVFWIFFIQFLIVAIVASGMATSMYIGFSTEFSENATFAPEPNLFIILAIITIFVLISYFWAKLTLHYYRYNLTEDGFRKEKGVIWKQYTTIPYDRIQNVDIYRGVLARIFGLSDLRIQTAANESNYSQSSGVLPGLSKELAEELRDELIGRAKKAKNQGL